LLRPALETAVIVARAGEGAVPRQPAPPSLRPFLRFQKLPNRALEVARRALDDDEFRGRVRDVVAVDPEIVGEAGWLLLDRPAGWEDELAGLVVEAGRDDDERRARETRRDLEGARVALARAEATTFEARAERDRLSAELEAERSRRRQLEEREEALVRQVEVARTERVAAVRELKDFESRLADRTAALRAATVRIAELEAADTPEVSSSPSEPPIDRKPLGLAIDEAADAVTRLDQALAQARRLLDPSPDPSDGRAGRARRPPAVRRPSRLPGGLLEESPEAVEHLLRLPAAILVVDGYNVSMRGWPDQELSRQRQRLIDAVASIGARTGADSIVVFDGAEVGTVRSGARHRHVQVRFSPVGVEADDVVLALADELPVDTPVIVVSDDRRVRDGARARGANVVAVDQFLALLRIG
jgi:predicted RNA-binding protein with PIN domain